MRAGDAIGLAMESMRLHRLRTGLTLAAIGIGVTAVLLLTALGDAAKGYVVKEFAGIGTNLVVVLPGRVETTGMAVTAGGTTRDLTLEDAEAIARQAPAVRRVAPLALGTAPLAFGGLVRTVFVAGTTADIQSVRNITVAGGQFFPPGDPRVGAGVVVIGRTIQRELFRGVNPLGQTVRLAQWRFRVIGVTEQRGHSLGMDFDDFAWIPVATGLKLFNQSGLFRILVQANDAGSVPAAVRQVREIVTRRHDGDEDFTVITQDAMLQTFRSIIDALTVALAGIAAISLGVAGIGIMNVMLVSVSERTSEVGLLKAIGARRRQILGVFLLEALLLTALGAGIGVLAGVGLTLAGAGAWPNFPLQPSGAWIAVVVALALVAGAAFGLMPARRAARLDAAEALRGRR